MQANMLSNAFSSRSTHRLNTTMHAPATCSGLKRRCCQGWQPYQLLAVPAAVHKRVPAVHVHALLSSTTQNPAFRYGKLNEAAMEARRSVSPPMTLSGTVNKTLLLLVMASVSGAYTWMQIFSGTAASAASVLGAAKGAGMVAIGAALASMFKPEWSQYTAPVYALGKGVALAALSAFLEVLYPGIAMNAVLITFSTAASLLLALQTGLVNVTDRFASSVRAATGGYCIAMLAMWLLSMCGLRLHGLFSAGPLAIGLGLVSAGLAASNLLLDFDFIRQASRQRLPKWMEWYSAQSALLTLVWMYTEVLRLLMLFSGGRRDD